MLNGHIFKYATILAIYRVHTKQHDYKINNSIYTPTINIIPKTIYCLPRTQITSSAEAQPNT